MSQDLISDSTRDIYEQLNNGGKCGDSVDGSGMPVCAYFQLNAKFTSNKKVAYNLPNLKIKTNMDTDMNDDRMCAEDAAQKSKKLLLWPTAYFSSKILIFVRFRCP